MNKVQDATKEYLKKDIPEFDTGDTLVVSVLVREGNKERVQNFEGVFEFIELDSVCKFLK